MAFASKINYNSSTSLVKNVYSYILLTNKHNVTLKLFTLNANKKLPNKTKSSIFSKSQFKFKDNILS